MPKIETRQQVATPTANTESVARYVTSEVKSGKLSLTLTAPEPDATGNLPTVSFLLTETSARELAAAILGAFTSEVVDESVA